MTRFCLNGPLGSASLILKPSAISSLEQPNCVNPIKQSITVNNVSITTGPRPHRRVQGLIDGSKAPWLDGTGSMARRAQAQAPWLDGHRQTGTAQADWYGTGRLVRHRQTGTARTGTPGPGQVHQDPDRYTRAMLHGYTRAMLHGYTKAHAPRLHAPSVHQLSPVTAVAMHEWLLTFTGFPFTIFKMSSDLNY